MVYSSADTGISQVLVRAIPMRLCIEPDKARRSDLDRALRSLTVAGF